MDALRRDVVLWRFEWRLGGDYGSGGQFRRRQPRIVSHGGDYSTPGWYGQPPGTQAFEWQRDLPEPARFSAERLNAGEVRRLRRSALEMQVRNPGSGSH